MPHSESLSVERSLYLRAVQLANQCSVFGDGRPIAACAFSPDGSALATASWSGLLKLWDGATCEHRLTVRAHAENIRVTGAPWFKAICVGVGSVRFGNYVCRLLAARV